MITACTSPVESEPPRPLGAGAAIEHLGAMRADAAQWQPCEDNPAVECTSVAVPLDWSEPAGPTIEIAVARRASADPDLRVGSLVYAPAGPGSSGVDTLTNDDVFGVVFPDSVRQRFDVVSVDPRGVGRSSPVLCDESLFGLLDRPAPRNQTEFEDLLDAQHAVGRSCRERTGPVIDHLDSNAAARDLDALREALGEEKLTIYALSYGTVLGQMYAEKFPERIRAMVLDSTLDHSADTEHAEVTGARAAQESFDVFVDWCDESAACALHGEDVRGLVADLVARADAGELTDPDSGSVLDRRGLAQYLLAPLGNAAVAEVAERIVRLTEPRDTSRSDAPDSSRAQQFDPSALPIYLYCADHRHDVRSYADAQRIGDRMAEVAPDVKTGWHGPPQLCLNPPFETTNPQHELDVDGAPPILVTNSRYDDSTPHENAQRVAEQIGDARLVTYDGLGHGAATRGTCMQRIVTDYLVDLSLPAPGTRCPAEPLP